MTQFETLEIIYNQLFNLADEIKVLVENENYNIVVNKLQYKDQLINKFINAKKTAQLSDEEKEFVEALDKKLDAKEHDNLAFCEKIHKDLAVELNVTQKKVKMNSAYDIRTDKDHGQLIDTSE